MTLALAAVCSGCPSAWKIHGGPAECIRMCQGWKLQFAGMVGVGNQDPSGDGATACVCQVGSFGPQASSDGKGAMNGAMSASLAAPISAAEAAAAAMAAQQRQMQMQQSAAMANGFH